MPTTATRATAPTRRSPVLATFGPNWFAVVMGTGIVAVCAATLPVQLPGLRYLADGAWLLALALLVVISAAFARHWTEHPVAARAHLGDPVMGHFYGAPPMALMTVAAGALLVGPDLVGRTAAVALAVPLWAAGTVLGVLAAVVVPRQQPGRGDAEPFHLMPVVPPMVSAATGPLMAAQLPATWRTPLLGACLALFAVAALACVRIIPAVVARAVRGDVGPAVLAPTWWIVLGPLGQSVTAAHHLGGADHPRLVLAYAVPVWTAALAWLALASVLVIRTARTSDTGLPFSRAWWAFTFPLGTVVTGTAALADLTGLVALRVLTVVLFAVLLALWSVVAVGTTSWLRRVAATS